MRMHVWTDRGWHGARTLQAPGCRAVARLDVQGGFGARRLPERRRPARCLPVFGCDTPHDAAETLCALRPRAGPVAAPATFAQPMPLPIGTNARTTVAQGTSVAGRVETGGDANINNQPHVSHYSEPS